MADNKILRKLFHLYFLFTRPMTLGVRVVVENEIGEVLLVRHTYVEGWYLPGGGVEASETMAQSASKELREEVGFEIIGEPSFLEFIKTFLLPNVIMLLFIKLKNGVRLRPLSRTVKLLRWDFLHLMHCQKTSRQETYDALKSITLMRLFRNIGDKIN